MIPDSYVQKNNPVKLKLETGLSVRSISGNILLNNTLSDAFDIEQRYLWDLKEGPLLALTISTQGFRFIGF